MVKTIPEESTQKSLKLANSQKSREKEKVWNVDHS